MTVEVVTVGIVTSGVLTVGVEMLGTVRVGVLTLRSVTVGAVTDGTVVVGVVTLETVAIGVLTGEVVTVGAVTVDVLMLPDPELVLPGPELLLPDPELRLPGPELLLPEPEFRLPGPELLLGPLFEPVEMVGVVTAATVTLETVMEGVVAAGAVVTGVVTGAVEEDGAVTTGVEVVNVGVAVAEPAPGAGVLEESSGVDVGVTELLATTACTIGRVVAAGVVDAVTSARTRPPVSEAMVVASGASPAAEIVTLVEDRVGVVGAGLSASSRSLGLS